VESATTGQKDQNADLPPCPNHIDDVVFSTSTLIPLTAVVCGCVKLNPISKELYAGAGLITSLPSPLPSPTNSPQTSLPPKTQPKPNNTHIIHLQIFLPIELRQDTPNRSKDVRPNRDRCPRTITWVSLSECTIVFETVGGEVWGAVDAVPVSVDYTGVVGLSGESCDACAFGVGDGFGATFAEVEDLRVCG